MTSVGELAPLPPPASEQELVAGFLANPALDDGQCARARALAAELVRKARGGGNVGPVERLMSGYSLSTEEGRALMGLAEALLRIPDAHTRDALIHDKVVGHEWLRGSPDAMVRFAGLMLSAMGYVLRDDEDSALHSLAHRAGVPAVRAAVQAGIRLLGQQFVLAERIDDAIGAAAKTPDLLRSYDMLGEGARTDDDALRYLGAYERAVDAVARTVDKGVAAHYNDGVSVKLSALHCRYRARCWQDVRRTLYPRLLGLAQRAKAGNVSLAIDAEEAARTEMSLALVRMLAAEPSLAGWDGLGVVVQAYGLRAGQVIDEVVDVARSYGSRLAVRLVKGAYWDAEIKSAQEKGLGHFPVYTNKAHTDLAYLGHARRLLELGGLVHPQFATHNAATLAALEVMSEEHGAAQFEVQRLQGMGDAVHGAYLAGRDRRCRVYSPVGRHDDLLAYLVRRLLENSANASFLHQFNDPATQVEELALGPYETLSKPAPSGIRKGRDLFAPDRRNSRCWDLDSAADLAAAYDALQGMRSLPPAPSQAGLDDVGRAFGEARLACLPWSEQRASDRARAIELAADAIERSAAELVPLVVREAQKTVGDAVAELREAADLCRHYAMCARRLPDVALPRGIVLAISPWNFPLAIFVGQVAAALCAGNTVVAKPAEQTPRVAAAAVALLHKSGVPENALVMLAGDGEKLGQALVGASMADMVVFTGSTATARAIHMALARSAKPQAPLLAETGGVNAMVVDSTALPERVVDDVLRSAFGSAGQRCSSLRMLYLHEEMHDQVLGMLAGAARALKVGDPADLDTDVGPLIDADAAAMVGAHLDVARADGRLIWGGRHGDGNFCSPAIVRVGSMADMGAEVFGPVLHVAPYPAGGEMDVIGKVNESGYGLTLGIHSRLAHLVADMVGKARVGNVYVNRNQVGAVVGSQPFGGRGLSGTGPKAGGPNYVAAFTKNVPVKVPQGGWVETVLPGPDGEENKYLRRARPNVARVGSLGDGLDAVLIGGEVVDARGLSRGELGALRRKMASLPGPLRPLVLDDGGTCWLVEEKAVCTDLTASGGNFALLSGGV